MLKPKQGLLTFEAEGNDRASSPWYSRVIHWPGNHRRCGEHVSGVTIGRGYDMHHRTKLEAYVDLTRANISSATARKIAEGAGLSSCKARDFVIANKKSIDPIMPQDQLALFNIDYPRYVRKAEQFYNKYKKSSAVSWSDMHAKLKDVFVDMLYQGAMRKESVPPFEKNSAKEVIALIRATPNLYSHENARKRIDYLEGI